MKIQELSVKRNITLEKKRHEGWRLDRSSSSFGNDLKWRYNLTLFSSITDIHCVRDFSAENIERIRALVLNLFQNNYSLIFIKYIDEFFEIRSNLESQDSKAKSHKIINLTNL